MANTLLEIRKALKNQANGKVRESTKKFNPTVKRNYGVKLPVLNDLANRFKGGGFRIVEALWKSGIFEEQLLAAKILGKICKSNPEKSLSLIKKFVKEISDWAVCDTLATQGIRKIAKIKQKEIFKLSERLINSPNLWQRRFALVILINYAKDRKLRNQIKKFIKLVENEKEYYVRKAINWLEKEIRL